jgi:hypothetical protein
MGARPLSLDNGLLTTPLTLKGADMETEKKDPRLAARVDMLLLALATHVAFHPEPGFVGALKSNLQDFKDIFMLSQVPDSYLEELDASMELFLSRIRR